MVKKRNEYSPLCGPCRYEKRRVRVRVNYLAYKASGRLIERYRANKDKILSQKKWYYEENKEKLLQKDRERYKRNKEKKKEYYRVNRKKILEREKKRYALKVSGSKSRPYPIKLTQGKK